MREDMDKVIVNKTRRGGITTSRNVRRGKSKFDPRKDPDAYVHPETRRKVMYADYKTFNDHLSPLFRYLARQCGRPWRIVYSEIRKHFGDNSTRSDHVREHVKMWVCTDRGYIDARLSCTTLNELRKHNFENRFTRFYVDSSGLLKLWPKLPYQRRDPDPPAYYQDHENPKLHYIMVAGCWYREDWSKLITHSVCLGDNFWVTETAPTVTQLASKEISRLGLHTVTVVNNEKLPRYTR